MEPPQGPRPVPPPRRPSGERRAMSPPGGEQREFWEMAPDGSSPPVMAVQGGSDKGQQRRERSSTTQTFCIVMEKRVQSHQTAPPGDQTTTPQGAAPQSHTATPQGGVPASHQTTPQGGAPHSHQTAQSHTATPQGGAPHSHQTAQSHTATPQGGAPHSHQTAQSHTATPQGGAPHSHQTAQSHTATPQGGAPQSHQTAPSHTATPQGGAQQSQQTAPPGDQTTTPQGGAQQSHQTAPSHTAMRQGGALQSHTAMPQGGAPQSHQTAPPGDQTTTPQGGALQSHQTAPSHTAMRQGGALQSHQTMPPGDQTTTPQGGGPQSHQTMPPGGQTATRQDGTPWSGGTAPSNGTAPSHTATQQEGAPRSHQTTPWSGGMVPSNRTAPSHTAPRQEEAAQGHEIASPGQQTAHQERARQTHETAPAVYQTVQSHETVPSHKAVHQESAPHSHKTTPPGRQVAVSHTAPPGRQAAPSHIVTPWIQEPDRQATAPSHIATALSDQTIRGPWNQRNQPDQSVPAAQSHGVFLNDMTCSPVTSQDGDTRSHVVKEELSSADPTSTQTGSDPATQRETFPSSAAGRVLDVASEGDGVAQSRVAHNLPPSPGRLPTPPLSDAEPQDPASPSVISLAMERIKHRNLPKSSTMTGDSAVESSALQDRSVPPVGVTSANQEDPIPSFSNKSMLIPGEQPSIPRRESRSIHRKSSQPSLDIASSHVSPEAAPTGEVQLETLPSTRESPSPASYEATATSSGVPPSQPTGGMPPHSNLRASALSTGAVLPRFNTGAAPLSEGTPALSNTEAAKLSIDHPPPHSETGTVPISSGSTPPLSNTGAAPLSNTGAAPLSNTGAAPLSTGGLSNSSPGASSASSPGGSKLSPVRVLDPPSPHRNKSKPPLPIPPRSNLYPGPLSEYDSSLRHETASLASYRSKAPAPDTLSYLDSVSLMSGTMESLSMLDDASSLGSDSEINGMAYRKTDKYGFLGGSQFSGNGENFLPVEIARQRELKWLDMFNHWDKWIVRRFQKVKLRCRKGIPSSMRAKAWQLLSNSHELLVKNPGKFDEMERHPGDPKWLDVIEKDLHRQFPFHEMFAARGGHGQQDLYRILKAYTIYRPEEGYCQAQAPVAAVLLMHMPAEQAFWCLVQICDKYLPGYYSAGLEAIQLDGEIFFALLRRISPIAYRHLKKFKIDPILYMTEWFMCIFSRTLPWSSVLRVWDMFFCEGVKIVFRVGLVLLKHTLGSAEKLRSCQGMYETMEKLRSLPTQCMLEDTLLPEVSSLPIADALIERESNTQLRKWRENRGELQYHPSRRLHGTRQIHEEKMRLNPALSGSRLSLSSLRRPSPPSTPSLVVHPESVVVSEGLRPALPSPTSNKAPLGPPKSDNKKVKEKQREEEKRREKEEREKHEREKKREKEERELERKREKEQKRAQKERDKMEAKQKKERKFSFRRKEQSSPAPDIQRKGVKGAEGEEGTVHDTYF